VLGRGDGGREGERHRSLRGGGGEGAFERYMVPASILEDAFARREVAWVEGSSKGVRVLVYQIF